MKVLHEWLGDYIGDGMPDSRKFEELFTFHAFEVDGIETIGGKEVIDVKVLPDRAGDCLSHRGIARELATLTGTPLSHDPLTETPSLTPATEKISISIENPENCRRFATALVTGVTVKESPEWLRGRLEALGQRSINNVVDATNYVMLSLGQPLHAYDGEKFSADNGVWRFGVRMAREGEEVAILGGAVLPLSPAVQVITNAASDTPVGIAGVKGGQSAEIGTYTTTVILEAASFNPEVTRKGAQALKLQTDASKRFENNLSPETVPYALRACAELITEIAGGVCAGYTDTYPDPERNTAVTVTLTHINALLGLSLTGDAVEDIFTRLGFAYETQEGGWSITAPFWRRDVALAEDVIAEVGRIHGYEHVASVVPPAAPLTEVNARHYYSEKVRDVLTNLGFSEVITSSFREHDDVELQNALASDKGCLRSSLKENIREALDRNMPNVDLLGLPSIQVFEIGTVFTKEGGDIYEHVSLGIGVRTKQQGYTPKDDECLRKAVSALEAAFGAKVNGTIERGVFECNFGAALETLSVPSVYEPSALAEPVAFTPYSPYPFISRDIALWVPEHVSAADVEEMIRECAGELLVRLTLFDEFRKEERTSYAFRLVFQSFERTLTDSETNTLMEAVYAEAKKRDFEVR